MMSHHYYKDKHYRHSSSSSSSSSSSDDERKRWKKEQKRQKKLQKHGGGMNINVHVAGDRAHSPYQQTNPQYPYPGGGPPMGPPPVGGYPTGGQFQPQYGFNTGGGGAYPTAGGMPQPGPTYPTAGGMPQGPGYPGAGGMPQGPGYPGGGGGGGPSIGFNLEGGGAGYGMAPPGGPGYGMGPPQAGGPGYGMGPPQGGGPGYGMGPPQAGGPGYGMGPPQGGGPGYGMGPQGGMAPPPHGGGMPPPQGGGMPPHQGGGMPPPLGGMPPPGGHHDRPRSPYEAAGHGHKGPAPARPPPPTASGGGVYKNLGSLSGHADPALALAHQMSGLTIGSGGEQYSGTVRPASNFNVETDCQQLREAMRGIGTNEKVLVEITAHRSADQRQSIKKMYKTMFGKDLLADLKSELSGNFENLMIALFADPEYYDAHCLRNSMKGAGTREGVLIEILCTRTNHQIEAIKARYKKEFNRDLEKDIVSETSGQFKRLLVSCCQANRSELTEAQYQQLRSQGVSSVIDAQQVERDVNDLYNAGAKRWGTDESVFLRIMATRNVYHLRAVFDRYAQQYGKDIISVIKSEMSGDTESGYKTLVQTVINRPAYFAHALHKSMAGLGTNDSALIRIIVTRSEIDLNNIKQEFVKKHKKSVASFIRGDCSGDYKNLLLAIVGE